MSSDDWAMRMVRLLPWTSSPVDREKLQKEKTGMRAGVIDGRKPQERLKWPWKS